MTERYIANADLEDILQLPTDGGCLCSDSISTYNIFSTNDSARDITWMIQKRLDKLREI